MTDDHHAEPAEGVATAVSDGASPGPAEQHPELLLAAALAGGFVLAKVLRRVVG